MGGRYGFSPREFREIKVRFNIGGDLPLFKTLVENCYSVPKGSYTASM
jgi:hypothetical protein